MVKRYDRKAHEKRMRAEKEKSGIPTWRVKDAEEVQEILSVIRKVSTLRTIAEHTEMDVDAAKEALSKKGEVITTYKASGSPKWIGELLNDWLNIRREIPSYKFGAPNDDIGLLTKAGMGGRYRDLIFKEYGKMHISIGEVPNEALQPHTPERHKIIQKFYEENPEWTGWEKAERRRLEVESADRAEKKRLIDEEEGSEHRKKLRVEAEESRVRKLKSRLLVGEEVYKSAKSAEEKEAAQEVLINIKMTLNETEALVKTLKKELK